MKLLPVLVVTGVVAGALVLILIRGASPSLPPSRVELDASPESLARLATKKVFFGHQSVGKNILNGVSGLISQSPPFSGFRVVELGEGVSLDQPAVFHAKVGVNKDPKSKFAAFEKALAVDGVGSSIDAAILKLCYADIVAETDVRDVFAAYSKTVERIQQAHPNLVLVHCTVPLRVRNRGTRDDIQTRLFGHPDNVRRSEYNQLMRTHFGATRFFDLAALQSTHEDGTREVFARGGGYEALCGEYASDGGHLNSVGSERAARGFLLALARAVDRSGAESPARSQ